MANKIDLIITFKTNDFFVRDKTVGVVLVEMKEQISLHDEHIFEKQEKWYWTNDYHISIRLF